MKKTYEQLEAENASLVRERDGLVRERDEAIEVVVDACYQVDEADLNSIAKVVSHDTPGTVWMEFVRDCSWGKRGKRFALHPTFVGKKVASNEASLNTRLAVVDTPPSLFDPNASPAEGRTAWNAGAIAMQAPNEVQRLRDENARLRAVVETEMAKCMCKGTGEVFVRSSIAAIDRKYIRCPNCVSMREALGLPLADKKAHDK